MRGENTPSSGGSANPSIGRTIDVHFTPPTVDAVAGMTLIIIDTLRATTAITTLLAAGAKAIYPCAGHAEARSVAATLSGSVLCGESNGLKVDGFDYGNSPTEFEGIDVRGWTVVQSTSNGTRALALTASADVTFAGCLRNRTAVAQAALRRSGAIAIVCSGDQDATAPSVEDSFTAGAVVEAVLAADATRTPFAGAVLARRLFRSYRRSSTAAFAESPHAAHLRRLGFANDLRFAGEMDVESVVPLATIDGKNRVVVRAARSRA